MKVALLISGHLRTFKKCFPYLKKNLLNCFDVDVFIHTWDEIESKTKSWHNQHMNNYKIDTDIISFINKNYSPKMLKIETQIDFKIDGTLADADISLNGLKNMTYGFKSVYDLLKDFENKNNIQYDRLIKVRPDVALKHPFPVKSLEIQDKSILFFGNRCPVPLRQVEYKFYHDYRALDILSVCSNDSAALGVYGLYDNFDIYYTKKDFMHSPYLDLVIDRKINFDISRNYLYGTHWEILRG